MTLVNDGLTAAWVFAGWTLQGDGRLIGEGADMDALSRKVFDLFLRLGMARQPEQRREPRGVAAARLHHVD